MMRRILLPVLLLQPAAYAQECVLPDSLRTLHPADGATNIAPNTTLLMLVPSDFTPAVELKDDQGTPVPSNVTVLPSGRLAPATERLMVLTPQAPLTGGTLYRVSQPVDAGVTWRFTVGGTSITTAPARPAVQESLARYLPPDADGGCGEVPARLAYEVTAEAPAGAAFYELYEGPTLVAARTNSRVAVETAYTGNEPERCFTVIAVNVAGQRSPPSLAACVGGDEERIPLQRDAGVGDAAEDVVEPTDAGAPSGPSAPGCSSSAGGSLLGLLALALRRRPPQ